MAGKSTTNKPAPAQGKRATGYQHPYSHYAKLYGRSLKQIKRYAEKGHPLDDPDKMGPLLDRHRGGKPEDDFVEDEPRRASGELDEESIADALEAADRLRGIPAERMEGEGLVAAILGLHAFERHLRGEVRIALAGRHPITISRAIDAHAAVLEQMRKFEKDTPGILARNEKQVAIADVEAKVGAVILAFCQALDALPSRAAGKLAGMDFNDRLGVLQKECDLVKLTLEGCAYLGAVPLQATPAP